MERIRSDSAFGDKCRRNVGKLLVVLAVLYAVYGLVVIWATPPAKRTIPNVAGWIVVVGVVLTLLYLAARRARLARRYAGALAITSLLFCGAFVGAAVALKQGVERDFSSVTDTVLAVFNLLLGMWAAATLLALAFASGASRGS